MRVVIIPGMGCTPVHSSNWYSWLQTEIGNRPDRFSECVLCEFPDPHACKESVWIPFVENEIGLDDSTVVVGHSSGAACVMRLLERRPRSSPLRGAILVAAAHTDMGDADERRSEYFSRPWDWTKLKEGATQIHQFHGTEDYLIPVAEGRHVAEMLEGDNFEYDEMPGHTHFFRPFQQLLEVIDRRF
jgi:hypothetical protein